MTSKLSEMQARFQQKQIQDREEKLLRLYENQQQRAFERVGRGSAGSNTSVGSTGGKVRQMFDERRQKAGVDRSYPLEPLKGAARPKNTSSSRTIIKSTVQKTVNHVRNGQPIVNTRKVVQSVYNNNDQNESYVERTYDNLTEDKDIVELMNNHNLVDNLDDEEMPEIGFNDVDDNRYLRGKLANVGGKLPSETIVKTPRLGKTFRKETKPIVKRTVRPAVSASSPIVSSTQTQPSKSTSSVISSSARPASQTMFKKQPPAQPPRAPSNARPSSKQTSKSPVARDDLTECKFCNRRFASDRLQVHEEICGKTGKKKRRTYDATKHRLEGTDLEPYVRRGGKPAPPKASAKPATKKDWRKTHEEFINTIRAAKMTTAHLAKGGKLSDLPPPPPSSNPDYVQCPHCGRKFNESAAERHIPKCATFSFNKPKGPPPAKGRRF